MSLHPAPLRGIETRQLPLLVGEVYVASRALLGVELLGRPRINTAKVRVSSIRGDVSDMLWMLDCDTPRGTRIALFDAHLRISR